MLPRTTQVGSDLTGVQAPAPPDPYPALPWPWEVSAPRGHAYQGVDELSPGLARAPDGQSGASLCKRKESMSISIGATSIHLGYPAEQLMEQARGEKKPKINPPPKKPQEVLPHSRLAR